MSDEKKLTISDPVDGEILKRFEALQVLRDQLANRNLEIDQEKVRIQRAAAQVEGERQKLFESVLIARGLPPNFPVEIDSKTGVITTKEEIPSIEAPTSTNGSSVEATA